MATKNSTKIRKANSETTERKISKKVKHPDCLDNSKELVSSIKVTCKTFGGCFIDENGNFVGTCSGCSENELVKSLCIISNNPEIAMVEKAKGKKGEDSESLKKIIAFLATPKTMRELQAHMGTKTTLYNICGRHSSKIAKVGKLWVAI